MISWRRAPSQATSLRVPESIITAPFAVALIPDSPNVASGTAVVTGASTESNSTIGTVLQRALKMRILGNNREGADHSDKSLVEDSNSVDRRR
jgi:hypothetical protein